MNDDEREQLAIDYLAGELDAAAVRDFEAELAADAELRQLLDRLEATMGELILAPAAQLLPPALRERVLAAPRKRVIVSSPWMRGWVPWSLAAGLAVACFMQSRTMRQARLDFTTARQELAAEQAERKLASADRDAARLALATAQGEADRVLQRERFLAREAKDILSQNLALRATVDALRGRDSLAQMRIATLSAKLASFAQAGVTIVWDQEKQRGVMQIANLPKLGPGKDYQLWVIDPKYPIPVNGGVIRTVSPAISRVFFMPDQRVDRVDQFAITIERTGGVPKAEGPLVLAGG